MRTTKRSHLLMKLSQTKDGSGDGRRHRKEYHERNGEAAATRVATFALLPTCILLFGSGFPMVIGVPILRMLEGE